MTTSRRYRRSTRTKQSYNDETIDLYVIGQGGTPCPFPPKDLGYVSTLGDAEERMAAGQEQKQCERCKLWRWKDEQEACDNKIKRSQAPAAAAEASAISKTPPTTSSAATPARSSRRTKMRSKPG